VVLTGDVSAFLLSYPQVNAQKVVEVADLVSLNNSSEVLLLMDSWGTVFDSICYGKENTPKVGKEQSLARSFSAASADEFFASDFVTPGSINNFALNLKLSDLQKLDTKLSTQIHNLSTFDLQPDLAKISLNYNGALVDEYALDYLVAKGAKAVEFQVENKDDFYGVWQVNLRCELDSDDDDNCLAFSRVSSQGVLVINEVMPSPLQDGSEWLELYNTGSEKVEIDRLQIRDKSGDVSRFDLAIVAGEYLVLTADLAGFSQTYPQIDLGRVIEVEDLVSLNNSDEVLILEDSLGCCFDSVSYGKVDAPKGVSLEKFGYGDFADIWGECLEDATPGVANSVRIYDYKDCFAVSLSSNVCTEDEPVVISYSVPELAATVRVHCRIFDRMGNLRRSVSNYRRSAIKGELIFDGRDDSGESLKKDVYLLKLTISKGNTLYHKQFHITIK